MTRDCTEVLNKLLPHTSFDCRGFGEHPYADFRNVYRVVTGRKILDVEWAKPNVPEDLLTELTDVLRARLNRYIVDDQFGNGLVHALWGHSRAPGNRIRPQRSSSCRRSGSRPSDTVALQTGEWRTRFFPIVCCALWLECRPTLGNGGWNKL